MNLRPVSVGAALAATLSAHLCSAQQPKVVEPTHTASMPEKETFLENPFHLGDLLQVHLRRRRHHRRRRPLRLQAGRSRLHGRHRLHAWPAFSSLQHPFPDVTYDDGHIEAPDETARGPGFISCPAQALLTTTLI